MKLSLVLFSGFLFTTSAAGEGRRALKNKSDSSKCKAAQPLVGEGCTADDVTLKRRLDNAISTVDYGDSMPISVTFEIAHHWGDFSLDHFFVPHNSPLGGYVCHKTDDFADDGSCVPITAQCMENNNDHVATVTLTAVDLPTTTDGPEIPQACCGAVGIVAINNVVKYVFELQCDPACCEPVLGATVE
jgi:hypothetical protein